MAVGQLSNPEGATAGWYTDPTERHETRYHDGLQWTGLVADGTRSERRTSQDEEGLVALNDATTTTLVSLCQMLQAPYPERRRDAAKALAEAGDSRAVGPLASRVGDDDKDVRAAVIAALGRIGTPEAIEALAEVVRTGTDLSREAAAAALSDIRDPRAAAAIGQSSTTLKARAITDITTGVVVGLLSLAAAFYLFALELWFVAIFGLSAAAWAASRVTYGLKALAAVHASKVDLEANAGASPAADPIAMTGSPFSGWYPDPDTAGQERWWDGYTWTATTRRALAASERERAGSLYSVVAIVCGLVAVGVFPVVFAGAGLAAGITAKRRQERLALLALSVVVAGGIVGVIWGAATAGAALPSSL